MMTKEEALARPEGLDENGNKAYDAIIAALKPYDPNPGGCQTFYSPEQWRERGERHGRESVLIVVYDGGDVAPFFNMDQDTARFRFTTEMSKALEAAGFFAEECTNWYAAVYPS